MSSKSHGFSAFLGPSLFCLWAPTGPIRGCGGDQLLAGLSAWGRRCDDQAWDPRKHRCFCPAKCYLFWDKKRCPLLRSVTGIPLGEVRLLFFFYKRCSWMLCSGLDGRHAISVLLLFSDTPPITSVSSATSSRALQSSPHLPSHPIPDITRNSIISLLSLFLQPC